MTRIFINPGHGGTDPGAVGNGLKEKDLNLKIAKQIYDCLRNDYECTVKLFRNNDTFYTLKQITDEANKWKADIFVSIHINASGGTGFESFIYTGNVGSKTENLQKDIHNAVMKEMEKYDVRDRGTKRKDLHVVRETKMPAVLTENLFIDNVKDAKLLKDNKVINDIVKGHVLGIAKHTKIKKKKQEKPKEKINDNVFYRVVTGSFNDKKNADDRVKELKAKGFDSFIDVYKK